MDVPVNAGCFHCGGPVAPDSSYRLVVEGQSHRVCCGGCQAAAQLVLSQGLGRYYEFRSGQGSRPASTQRDWTVFDREAALRTYTHLAPTDGCRSVSLQLDGLHCAACAWLIENSLRQLPGLVEIHVDATAARAELRFDPQQVPLSRVLARVHELGFAPTPLSFSTASSDDGAERRVALQRLAVAGFGMMQVMTFAVSLYAGALQGMDANIAHLLRLVSLVVATPVVLFSAQPFFIGAWRSLRAGTLGMDVPVALSIAAAYLWSVCSTLLGTGSVYFDSAVMFTFFLLLGRYVEMSLRHRSGMQQHALARLLPDSVLRLRDAQTERVIPDELRVGDHVRVLPGERIAADGIIECGRSEIDESLLTGEAVPRTRGIGEQLTAGTLNLSAPLDMRVSGVGQDSTLAAISRLLALAQASRPRFADQADRVAAWFVAAVLLLAIAVGMYWLHQDAARAFPTVLAVLVVTCPCALSLATPAALAAATTRLARVGLLVRRGRALDHLALADRIVFDKTGTLTRGRLRLERVRVLDQRCDRERSVAIAAALERYSNHPIAHAFDRIDPAPGVSAVATAAGRGVEAVIDGRRYRIGRVDYAAEICAGSGDTGGIGAEDSQTAIVLADERGLLASFALSDTLRDDARTTVQALLARHLLPQIASGDRDSVVASIARALGGVVARAGLDAAGKLNLLRALQRQGHRVAMVGDGVNDAPVLAAADVSIAVGGGTDLAKVSADLVLLGDELAPVVTGIDIARRTRTIIRQNLIWAALYNATAVPLAALGLLQPWMAAIGMSSSSLLVVLNAMRLLRLTPSPSIVPSVAASTPGEPRLARVSSV